MMILDYNQHTLKGNNYKTDISLKQTPGIGLLLLFNHFIVLWLLQPVRQGKVKQFMLIPTMFILEWANRG